MYAEVGPQVRCAAVMPPSNDDSVPYTSLLHDQNRAKDPEGMSTLYHAALKYQLKLWIISNYLHYLLGNPHHPGHTVYGSIVCMYQSSIMSHHDYFICRKEAT